ncbi:TraB/GumN family protein [Mitsuaria sp. WAJ17]|uniref:TraB/GumN family protein n=1 Tax=Mitsuaria sp. WAJ17 TaxID=2761452 RepID=UPI0015FFB97E|nr:TraB/GumN family protein [Mitsuaria sp. WAJ17]MBB2487212.1 TraB/GumN family protein [Mitsuaria sp. WAJ17]
MQDEKGGVPPFFCFEMRNTLILLFSMLSSMLAHAGDGGVKHRAWVVEFQGAKATIIPETHESLPFELDDYFFGTVIPAIRDVAAVQVESEVAPALVAPTGGFCPDDETLLPARAEQEQDAELLRRWTALAAADGRTGQFNFVALSLPVQVLLARLDVQRQRSSAGTLPDRATVYELVLRAVSGASLVLGLESFDDRWRAFCSAPKEVRDEAVIEAIRQADRKIRLINQDLAEIGSEVPKLSFEASLACIDKVPLCSAATFDMTEELLEGAEKLGLPCGKCAATNYVLIKGRNPPMATNILKAMKEHRRIVVLLGADHLPTLQYQDGAAPGVIDLLRAAGATVSMLMTARK